MPINTIKSKRNAKEEAALEKKLGKKIDKEIDQFEYIGDIDIDDDEYRILKNYLKQQFSNFENLERRKEDTFLAVALVQIGIREYDGSYWSHVSRIAECKLDGIKQDIIGNVFYNTLKKHKKYHLKKGQIVKNILMHCFITKHYAGDFFEFLFAYYQHDLARDLNQHEEMQNYLITNMKKEEKSSRAYLIRKGTADAACANEEGCKKRVWRILEWIDTCFFENRLPEEFQNQTAQFFCEWAKKSERFIIEKRKFSGVKKSKKYFHTPYLNFNEKQEKFRIILPAQTVPLKDCEIVHSLIWKITYKDKPPKKIESKVENTAIGCRNCDDEEIEIESADIFSKFCIELIKNNKEIVKRFSIKEDSVRLFDEDFDHFTEERLYEGTVYAFTQRGQKIQSDGISTCDHCCGLDLYSIELEKGNIVEKPDGKVLFVGKEIKEGLSENKCLEDAFVLYSGKYLPVYNKAPSLLLKMPEEEFNGTCIRINGNKHHLDREKCAIFEQNKESYCLIHLEKYILKDGIYEILIDLPSKRSIRDYSFALSRGLNYEFVGAPYVFKTEGKIYLRKQDEENGKYFEKITPFSINSESKYLNIQAEKLQILFLIPLLKWKFDLSDDWNTEKPKEMWHKELPDHIYFQTPFKNISLCSNQITFDNDELQNIKCDYNDKTDCYVCDTRKIKSWLEIGSAIHKTIYLVIEQQIPFLYIITRSVLLNCSLEADEEKGQLVIKSTIIGFENYAVDIYCNDKKINEKEIPLLSNGTRFSTNVLSGQFEVVFFEYGDDDELDFGEPIYLEFDRRSFMLHNLIGKTIEVKYWTQKNSIFKNGLNRSFSIKILKQDEEDYNIYYGKSRSNNKNLSELNIQIEILDKKTFSKALIFFYDEKEDDYVDFTYDETEKQLLLSDEGKKLPSNAHYHIKVK